MLKKETETFLPTTLCVPCMKDFFIFFPYSNRNHANIAIGPNGFHWRIIAEHTNTYGAFSPCAAESVQFYEFWQNDLNVFSQRLQCLIRT